MDEETVNEYGELLTEIGALWKKKRYCGGHMLSVTTPGGMSLIATNEKEAETLLKKSWKEISIRR